MPGTESLERTVGYHTLLSYAVEVWPDNNPKAVLSFAARKMVQASSALRLFDQAELRPVLAAKLQDVDMVGGGLENLLHEETEDIRKPDTRALLGARDLALLLLVRVRLEQRSVATILIPNLNRASGEPISPAFTLNVC